MAGVVNRDEIIKRASYLIIPAIKEEIKIKIFDDLVNTCYGDESEAPFISEAVFVLLLAAEFHLANSSHETCKVLRDQAKYLILKAKVEFIDFVLKNCEGRES